MYDPQTAHRLALLSSAAYLDGYDAEREALAIGADEAQAIDTGNVEFLIARFGPDVMLTFRGTSEGDDVIRDAWALLAKRQGIPGRIHTGLSLGALESFCEVSRNVQAFLGDHGFIDVGGHSKGGAEAIFTAWLLNHDMPVRSVHVFGCPAVGDREFVYELTAALPEVYSHVYRSDIVARSPILLRLLGVYWPSGRTVFHDDSWQMQTRVSWWKWLVDSVKAISRRRGIDDHAVRNYVSATRRSVQ